MYITPIVSFFLEPEAFGDEDYAKLYGRMRTLTNPAAPGVLYVGEWE